MNGYDISQPACDDYKRIVKADAYIWDITKEKINSIKHDYVIIFGGLHHCINDLNAAFQNIFNMLNDNGKLIMVEPNKRFIFDFVRTIWHKFDNYFEANTEDSLNHTKLLNIQKENSNLIQLNILAVLHIFLSIIV